MFFISSVRAEASTESDNNYINVARNQLAIARDSYNASDLSLAKDHLKRASKWLTMAVLRSKSEEIKSVASQLSSDITAFNMELNESSGDVAIVRFWQQASWLIKSESDQLINGYTETSKDNTTLRKLLDAKMRFYTADYDLFVSHNSVDAKTELNETLVYLKEASEVCRPDLRATIQMLESDINKLLSLIEENEAVWQKNELIQTINDAIYNMEQARGIAAPDVKNEIDIIYSDLKGLRKDLKKTDVKTQYDSITLIFNRLVQEI